MGWIGPKLVSVSVVVGVPMGFHPSHDLGSETDERGPETGAVPVVAPVLAEVSDLDRVGC